MVQAVAEEAAAEEAVAEQGAAGHSLAPAPGQAPSLVRVPVLAAAITTMRAFRLTKSSPVTIPTRRWPLPVPVAVESVAAYPVVVESAVVESAVVESVVVESVAVYPVAAVAESVAA